MTSPQGLLPALSIDCNKGGEELGTLRKCSVLPSLEMTSGYTCPHHKVQTPGPGGGVCEALLSSEVGVRHRDLAAGAPGARLPRALGVRALPPEPALPKAPPRPAFAMFCGGWVWWPEDPAFPVSSLIEPSPWPARLLLASCALLPGRGSGKRGAAPQAGLGRGAGSLG